MAASPLNRRRRFRGSSPWPASRGFGVAAALTAIACLAAACGGTSTPTSHTSAFTYSADTGPARGPVSSFSWALYDEPSSLDWVYTATYPPNTVLSNVCESLLRLNPNYTITPALASSYSHPNPLTWVYQIRPGVRFHDGGTLTAADVAYSLERNLNPKVGSYWGAAYVDVKTIAATGPHTVTVTLKHPDVLFNEYMATVAGVVDSKSFIEREGARYGTPQGLVDCTGPFRLASWQKGNQIVLTKFGGYWDKSLTPHAQQVVFKFLPDPAARATALETGRVDGAYYITPAGTQPLRHSSEGRLYYGRNPTVRSLILFDLKGALKDPRVRQALSLAINRQQLVQAALGGAGSPAWAPVGPDAWCYASGVFRRAYDRLTPPSYGKALSQARQLVKAAGSPQQPIVIASSNSDPSYSLDALAVQSAGQQIGLNVKIDTLPIQEYDGLFADAKLRATIDLYQSTWYLDMCDPLEFYGQYEPPQLFDNFNNWTSPAYSRIEAQALAAIGPARRAQLVVRLQQMFMKNTLWIPLYTIPNTLFLNKRLAGAPTTLSYLYYPWAALVGSSR
jgi:peptide/nickel transport system substrate-binding protein